MNYLKKNAESDKPFTVNKQVRERSDLDILHGEKKLSQILLITIWIADPLFQNMGARYIPTVMSLPSCLIIRTLSMFI